MRLLRAGILALIAASTAAPAAAGAATITEYPIPAPDPPTTTTLTPRGITAGPDGRLWIIDSANHSGNQYVVNVTTSGSVGFVPLATNDLGFQIVTGPGSLLWFSRNNTLSKLPTTATQAADVTSLPATHAYNDTGESPLVLGADGQLWFMVHNDLSEMDAAGTITARPTGISSLGGGLGRGPDDKLWYGYADASGDLHIARMATSGTVGAGNDFDLGTSHSGVNFIAEGPDGNMWFTTSNPAAVARITPAGTATFFDTPTANSLPYGIAAGSDGRMWFAERNGDAIGVIATDATSGADITEYPVGHSNAGVQFLAAGPDCRMWFTEFNESSVAAITTPACGAGGQQQPPSPSPSVPPPLAAPVAVPGLPLPITLPTLSAASTVIFPSSHQCASRRKFAIRLHLPRGVTATNAIVLVNGKRAKVVRGARLTSPIDLRGFVKGRFVVDITVHTNDGRTIHGTRRYHTCVSKRTQQHRRGV